MAFRVANGTGNWSAAGTWWTAANTPTIHASTNLTITTGGIFTQPFTAAASVDSITGVVVYPVASWSGKTITFTLQANSVDTATTVVITGADVALNLPLFIKLAVPVLQVATTVYRFKVTTNTGTCTIAQSITASQIAAIITNNVTGAPASGDSVFIHSVNANTDTTVTIDDTSAICGSNAAISGATAFASSNRYWDMAIQFNGGVTGKAYLTHATGANSTIELKNSVWQGFNGIYTSKPTSAYLSTVNWTPGATTTTSIWWNFAQGSQYDIQGAGLTTPSYWKSKQVSGTGTAASPLVVNTSVGWTVGDYLVFHPTGNGASNYNETEYRYIITKNSATSYVLSSTSGGSENALTNTHTGGYVFNQTAGKNVVWKATDGNNYHILFNSTVATTANSIFKWARVSNTYSSTSSARGSLSFAAGIHDIQYISLGIPGVASLSQLMYFASNANAMTLRGIFAFGVNPATSQDGVINTPTAASNKQFYDCHIIDVNSVGWKLSGANPYLDHCTAIACGKTGVADLYAGFNIGLNSGTFVDCEQHSNRLQGTLYYASSADVIWTRFISGTLGTNGDLAHQASGQISYQTAYYDTPTFGDTNLMTGNALLIEGSQIVFSDVNGTAYNNYKYTNNGTATFTGAGLTDTTVPNIGTYTYRHAPLTTTGMKYRYRQLVTPSAVFITYGRVWGNSTFVSDGSTSVTVDLYMPGVAEGDTPSATTTMTKTTDKTSENSRFTLTAANTATRPQYATIVITVKNPSATSSAYAYIGDILNAENDTTKFKVVFKGEPSQVMPLGASTDPGSVGIYVWADNNVYSVGTKGKDLDDILSNTDVTQAKVDTL